MTLARSIFVVWTISLAPTTASVSIDKYHLRQYPNCGRFPMDEIANSSKLTNINRIANANELDFKIPWSLYIIATHNNMNRQQCSAGIITKKAALTAAHCVCEDDPGDPDEIPCVKPITTRNQIRADLRMNVYHNIENVNQLPPGNTYAVSEAYVKSNTIDGNADIGILILAREIAMAIPICLPSIRKTLDLKTSIAYLAGWGVRFQDGNQAMCQTNIIGPSKFERCANVPFPYCTTNGPPPDYRSVCKEIYQKALEAAPESFKELLKRVKVMKGNDTFSCYGPKERGPFGWCRTYPNSWGFCSKTCSFDSNDPNEVNARPQTIAEFFLYQDNQCISYLRSMQLSRDDYMCSRSRIMDTQFATVTINSTDHVISNFDFETEHIPRRIKNTNTNMCSGDSGAVLFKFLRRMGSNRFVALAVHSLTPPGNEGVCGKYYRRVKDINAILSKDNIAWVKEKAQVRP